MRTPLQQEKLARIQAELGRTNGNVTEAARNLGVTIETIHYQLRVNGCRDYAARQRAIHRFERNRTGLSLNRGWARPRKPRVKAPPG